MSTKDYLLNKNCNLGTIGKRVRPSSWTADRLIGTIDNDDFTRLEKREKGEDWVFLCQELGDAHLAYAEEQFELKNMGTGRYFLSAAAKMFFLAQYGLSDYTEEKLSLYNLMTETNKRYGSLAPVPWENVSIPYKNYKMEGYLILPPVMKLDTPILLVIGGGTTYRDFGVKRVENVPMITGMAVLVMDGPGQGTTRIFNDGFNQVNIEDAYITMIDWIKADKRFTNSKVGIQGTSTGGYYVARAAAKDKRIEACIINGGTYRLDEILNANYEKYIHHFAVLFGVSDDVMENDIFPQLTLEGIAEQIECPLLVINGQADATFAPHSSKRIYDEAKSKDKTLKLFPGADHCCMGDITKAAFYVGDWIRKRMFDN